MAPRRKSKPKAEPERVPVVHAKGRIGALCLKRIFRGDTQVEHDRADEVTCTDCQRILRERNSAL
jgi:ribosomal protein L37AE/L43A